MAEKTTPLSLDLIRTDGGTQMRAALSQETYLDYRDKWLSGVEFDPVDVFHDGSAYWLADGFHRFHGAREAKRSSLPCRIHQGTQRDAVLFAVGANSSHGLRRTNEDKRQAVVTLLNDKEWVKWADTVIAEKCHVSHELVRTARKQLAESASSPAAQTANEPRVGKDGKSRKPPRKSPKPKQEREPGDDPPDNTPSLSTVKRDGKKTIAQPTVDVEAFKKQYGALTRSIDDLAREANLNNSPNHRKATRGLGESLEAFLELAKECKAVLTRKAS